MISHNWGIKKTNRAAAAAVAAEEETIVSQLQGKRLTPPMAPPPIRRFVVTFTRRARGTLEGRRWSGQMLLAEDFAGREAPRIQREQQLSVDLLLHIEGRGGEREKKYPPSRNTIGQCV